MINHILPVIAVALEDEKPEVRPIIFLRIYSLLEFLMHVKIISKIVTYDAYIIILFGRHIDLFLHFAPDL